METPNEKHNKLPKWNKRRLALIGSGVLLSTGLVVSSTSCTTEAPQTTSSERPSFENEHQLHENITTTVFWAGENADNSNDFIHNRSSAWMHDWTSAYGGVDDPQNRCGYHPCNFTPKENPFYFALPFGDYTEQGLKSKEKLQIVPWYDEALAEQGLLLKNRWIEITHKGKKAYAQWEDVGPFNHDDASYVFGTAPPQEKRAGLDVSPAVSDYLQIGGRAEVSWRFIDESDVPDGEWKKIITHSAPKYE